MIDGKDSVAELVVTDVASHSLGVAVTKMIGVRQVHGYFTPVIHRNTVIPTTKEESFSTLHDNQPEVRLEVYEGDARRVEDNRRIGELKVGNIPKGKAPKSFVVRFTYDQNGMLEVEAEIAETKHKVSAVFKREGGEVTGAALEQARARLKAIRADPMDRPRYRDLHARAKLLWSELDAKARQHLDPLIDAYEAAMTGRKPDDLERAYRALLQACETIDHGDRW